MTNRLMLLAMFAVPLLGCPAPLPPPPDVRAVTAAPITSGIALVVVVDTSGSMSDSNRLETVKAVWQQTLSPKVVAYQNLYSNLEIALVNCGGSASVLVPLTSDPAAIGSAVAQLAASGGTPLGSAMAEAYSQVVASTREQKHIFVLTDGQSGDDVQGVLEAMKARGESITVHLIGFQSDKAYYTAFEQTGAAVVMADDAQALDLTGAAIFANILKPEAE